MNGDTVTQEDLPKLKKLSEAIIKVKLLLIALIYLNFRTSSRSNVWK